MGFAFHETLFILFRWGHDHEHGPSLITNWLFDDTCFADGILKLFKQDNPQIPVGHHSPEKHDVHFYFVSFIQEPQRISHLELEIVLFDLRLHLDFLEVDDFLILPGRVLSFALLILKFSKIHHPAYRRIGLRRNFHQVHPGINGLLKRIIYAQNANLAAFCIDDSDLRNVNLFVHPRSVVMLDGRL